MTTSPNSELKQAFDALCNATTAPEICNGVAYCHHYQEGKEGEPLIPTPNDIKPHEPVQISHDRNGGLNLDTIRDMYPVQVRQMFGVEGPVYQTPEISDALDAVQDEWENTGATTAGEIEDRHPDLWKKHNTLWGAKVFFDFGVFLIESLEERIVAIHQTWNELREADVNIPHLFAPIVRAWITDQNTKHITAKLDKIRPASIIKNPMGSVREINFTDSGGAQLREFATPERISQVNPDQMRLGFNDEPPSILPDIMPLEVPNPTGVKPTTKSGAVSPVVRIFCESIMALEPHERASDIVFRLGDLIEYLNPDGKFHRSTQLPYIIDALEILHIHATLPWIDDTGEMRKWRPVWVKSPLSMDSKNDAPVHMRVEVPPDARQGYMILKHIHRLLGKKSGPQWNAYHVACYLWDKHATIKGNLIDPTRPIDRRNEKGEIVGADGVPILTARGKPITNLYHDRVIAQGEREDNPAADRYPVLSKNDLIAACMPKATDTNIRRLWERAKKYWEGMEADGYIVIHKEGRKGWRIFPSQEHLAAYRGVSASAQKKV